MKNFVLGLLVVVVVIALVVIIKRIGSDGSRIVPDSSSSDITAGANGGDVLPQ